MRVRHYHPRHHGRDIDSSQTWPSRGQNRWMWLRRKATRSHHLPALFSRSKMSYSFRGRRATGGSYILYNYVAPYTATAVRRLEAAGAIVIGNTNCDEFVMGSSTENSAYGTVKRGIRSECRAAPQAGRQLRSQQGWLMRPEVQIRAVVHLKHRLTVILLINDELVQM